MEQDNEEEFMVTATVENNDGKIVGDYESFQILECSSENHYVFISDQFKKDIRKTNIGHNFVHQFIHALQTMAEPFSYGDCIRNSNLFKKDRDRTYRFLFQKEETIIDGVTFICLRAILRGHQGDQDEYKKITSNPTPFINDFLYSKNLVKTCFEKWQTDRSRRETIVEQEQRRIKELKLIEISQWIDNFNLNFDFDVYETAEWKQNSHKKLNTYGVDFLKLLETIILKHDKSSVTFEKIPHAGRENIIKATKDNACIIYEKIRINDKEKFLLYNCFEKYDEQDEQIARMIDTIFHDKRFQFTVTDGMYDKKEVSRCAERAYPSLIIDIEDREIWFDIQNDTNDNANLSLLPDQVDLLENIKFPFFINGQAGSGKSTMLYYLFAQFCYKKLIEADKRSTPQNKIIFITDNQHLLKNSLKEIAMLLRKNPQYSMDIIDYFAAKIDPSESDSRKNDLIQDLLEKQITVYFSSFIHFLRNQLEDPDHKFPLNQYIDFYRFREAYLNSRAMNKKGQWEQINLPVSNPVKEKYSPEVAWYIIRTFIKGYSATRELTQEDFYKIARNDRGSLDEETYRAVYLEIYEKFYKILTRRGYWDNIDLVKEILDTRRFSSNFSIILCDEAQDFTKVELQTLIRFSEFYQFDLSRKNSFPVIFAGDPFQTVNPTGFSWTRLRSMFTEDIVQKLNLSINIEDRFEELKMNYRSTPMIVRVANMIQYFRRTFLDERDIKLPQVSRQYSDSHFLRPAILEVEKNLSEYRNSEIGLSIFIAPCEPGGEESFIREDNLNIDDFIIRSAAFLKGLEHDTIIIYKFGQHFVNDILRNPKITQIFNRNSLNDEHIPDGTAFMHLFEMIRSEDFVDDDISFKIAYFFNKLYVAITRAKQELIVMDTETGVNAFWRPFLKNIETHLNHESALSADSGDEEKNENWRYQILGSGNQLDAFDFDSNYKKDITKTEQIRIAHKKADEFFSKGTEDQGIDSVAIESLNLAIQYYKRSGLSAEAEKEYIDLCKAHIFRREKNWRQAGDLFQSTSDFSNAEACYWNGGCWSPLLDVTKNGLMRFVANLMLKSEIDLDDFHSKAEDLSSLLAESELEWLHDFAKKLIGRIKNIVTRSISAMDPEILLKTADSLVCLKLHNYQCTSFSADIYFNHDMFDKALMLWDPQKEENNIRFLYTRAITSERIEDKIKNYFHVYRWVKKNQISEKRVNLITVQNELIQIYKQHINFPFDMVQCQDLAEILIDTPDVENKTKISEVLDLFFINSEKKTKTSDEYSEQIAFLIKRNGHSHFIVSLLEALLDRARKNPLYVQMLGTPFYEALIRIKFLQNKVLKKIRSLAQQGHYHKCEEILKEQMNQDLLSIMGLFIKILVYAVEMEPEMFKSRNDKPLPIDILILSFSKYYVKNLSDPGCQKIALSIEEIANAVERTNKQYSVISRFYDTDISIDNSRLLTSDTRRFLQNRWLKVKQKQYQMDASGSGEADATKTLNTLNKFISQWGLSHKVNLETIEKDTSRYPDYPRIFKVTEKGNPKMNENSTVAATMEPEKENAEDWQKKIEELNAVIQEKEGIIEDLKTQLQRLEKDFPPQNETPAASDVHKEKIEAIITEINTRESAIQTYDLDEIRSASDKLLRQLFSKHISPLIARTITPQIETLEKEFQIILHWKKPYQKLEIQCPPVKPSL